MTERKSASGSDLEKVDAHSITPEEYDEIPELADEWFARAELHVGGIKVPRGRPRSPTRKQAIKLRLDPEVIERYRATGAGWQTRMNAALREAAPRFKKAVVMRNAAAAVRPKAAEASTKPGVKKAVSAKSKRARRAAHRKTTARGKLRRA
jgi:uncharacterized protein (DUF4415 family)